MTVLVGMIDNGVVYVGADSFVGTGWNGFSTPDRKVFKRNGVIVSGGGQSRAFLALRYKVGLPDAPDRDPYSWLYQKFLPRLKEAAEFVGMEVEDSGTKWACDNIGGLISVCNRLFALTAGLSVLENNLGLAADGVGGQIAMGALLAWRNHDPGWRPEVRLHKAMRLCEQACDGVRPPYCVISSNDPDDEL
jgi:hypothetical protein